MTNISCNLMPDSPNDPHRDDVDDGMHHSDLPSDLSGHHSLREASVLIPLLKQRDEWHVLYIRRTKNINDRHSGQVAFPGGARESGDINAVNTALRETREEIGISEDNISIVDTLPVYETVSFFSVTPVIGLLNWPSTMKLQSSEVARAFTIPLNWLLDESNHELRNRKPDAVAEIKNDAVEKPRKVVYFKEYDGELLWGASARITLNFLHALRSKRILIPGWQPG